MCISKPKENTHFGKKKKKKKKKTARLEGRKEKKELQKNNLRWGVR